MSEKLYKVDKTPISSIIRTLEMGFLKSVFEIMELDSKID